MLMVLRKCYNSMLLSLFQGGLVFNLSGRNSAQTKTTKHAPVRNCGNINGKKWEFKNHVNSKGETCKFNS